MTAADLTARLPLPSWVTRRTEPVVEALKFGLIGAANVGMDVGVFNLALLVGSGPLTAKVASGVVSSVSSYAANRWWTFKATAESSGGVSAFLRFMALNGVGILISLACLGVSHYALGLHGRLADNISGTLVGTALGTVFRFWSYRRFVFGGPSAPAGESR